MYLKELVQRDSWKVIFGVYVWVKLMKDWGKVVCVERSDITYISKIVRLYEKVMEREIDVDNMDEVEIDLRNFFEWLIVDCGKTIRSGYRYLPNFFHSSEESKIVNEFVDSYCKYVKERYNLDIVCDRRSREIERAAIVSDKMAKKFNISIYNVIKYQHEFWDGIKTPFAIKALTKIDKVEERLQRYFANRRGEVINNDKVSNVIDDSVFAVETRYLRKHWKDIKSYGIDKFATLSTKGFFAYICKSLINELSSAPTKEDKRAVLDKYTDDFVARKWIEMGKPSLF